MPKFNRTLNSKLHSYFITKLGAFEYKHGWLKMDCPHCGKENKYGINIFSNKTNCFVCGEHPQPIQLVMDLEGFETYPELRSYFDSTDFLDTGYKEENQRVEIKPRIDLGLPGGFHLIGYDDGSVISKSIINYVKKRGFNPIQLRRAGWGYCDSGKLFGYLVIPFFEKGKLVYYNARLFIGNGPRYMNPDTEETGIGKSFVIYNKEALSMFDKVFICEGAINAATLGENAISSGGKHLSRYQINEILKSQTKRVVVLLDPDAKVKALELAITLSMEKMVKVVFLPEGKDVNDLGKKETIRYVRRTPYMNTKELISLKQIITYNENSIPTYI